MESLRRPLESKILGEKILESAAGRKILASFTIFAGILACRRSMTVALVLPSPSFPCVRRWEERVARRRGEEASGTPETEFRSDT